MLSFRIVLITTLAVTAPIAGRTAVAQDPINVIITLRGDVGQYAGMCGNPGGEDKLSGSIQLISFDQEDRTAFYEGTLAAQVSAALAHRATRLLSVGVPRAFISRYGTTAQHDAALGLDASGIRARVHQFVGAFSKVAGGADGCRHPQPAEIVFGRRRILNRLLDVFDGD